MLIWQVSKKVTTLGAAEIQEKRHSLRRRIEAWTEIQRVYMPCVDQLRSAASVHASNPSLDFSASTSAPSTESDNISMSSNPELIRLLFPSEVPSSTWSAGITSGIIDKERRLRLAQADDALNELRRQLRISATLLDYKKTQVGGTSQKMSTWMRSLMSRFHDKTIRCAERYSAAYKALLILDPDGDWTSRFKFLDHKKDLRSPRRNIDDDPGESRRELSWIWLVSPGGGPPESVASADEINESMYSILISSSMCGLKPGTVVEHIKILT